MTIEERLNEAANEAALDETRSIKSEFDYSTKKKFVEMISQQPKDKRLKLPEGGAAKGEEDRVSNQSRRSQLSTRSVRMAFN